MNWPATGAFALALAVVLGAFGAHGLRSRLDAYSMGIWERAVLYHFLHALGLLIVPALAKSGLLPSGTASRVCLMLAAGILLFSGSLYALALSGASVLGALTPFGGLSFIAAWLYLAFELYRAR